MGRHDESMLELAALRAIGVLEADEAALIDEHMARCVECHAEFRHARAAGSALASSVSSAPPAALRDRVLAAAAKIRRIHPQRRRFWFPLGLAAAFVIVAAGAWFAEHRQPPERRWSATCGTVPCGEVVARGSVLRLEARGLKVLPAGKVYQAWIIHPHQTPFPEPTFDVSGGSGSVEMQVTPVAGDVVAVTVEPSGGSKQPTTKPLLVATLD